MVELLKVNYDEEQPTVSARDLHDALELKKDLAFGFQDTLIALKRIRILQA